MCVPVLRVHREAGLLTHIGGSWNGTPWGLTINEAAALIDSGEWDFFVEVPAGTRAAVVAKTSSAGNRFLTTSRDGVAVNNLEALPDLPTPLAGVYPPFPLTVPGTSPVSRSSIEKSHFRYKEAPSLLVPKPAVKDLYGGPFPRGRHDVTVPARFWTGGSRWLRFSALVPYPATYEVSQSISVSGEGSVTSLERVLGDDPERRFELEAEGEGWWMWSLVLTGPDGQFDPSKPSRMTEIEIVVHPGDAAWSVKDFVIGLAIRGVNPYCAPYLVIYLHFFTAAKAAEMPTPSCVIPNVVGKTVQQAFAALDSCHLNIYTIGSMLDITGALVIAQNVAPGTTVSQQTNLTLRVGKTATAGVREVHVTNSSHTKRSLDLWLFDFTTSGWKPQGTVSYQNTRTVSLLNQHVMWLAATDFYKTGCESWLPEEEDCVAWYESSPRVGATNGPSVFVTIP